MQMIQHILNKLLPQYYKMFTTAVGITGIANTTLVISKVKSSNIGETMSRRTRKRRKYPWQLVTRQRKVSIQ